jgi:hypothetical protein
MKFIEPRQLRCCWPMFSLVLSRMLSLMPLSNVVTYVEVISRSVSIAHKCLDTTIDVKAVITQLALGVLAPLSLYVTR